MPAGWGCSSVIDFLPSMHNFGVDLLDSSKEQKSNSKDGRHSKIPAFGKLKKKDYKSHTFWNLKIASSKSA